MIWNKIEEFQTPTDGYNSYDIKFIFVHILFSDNHLKLNSKAQATINSLTSGMGEVKDELSESIEKNIQLETQLEQSAVYLLISEKTNGLKKSDKRYD